MHGWVTIVCAAMLSHAGCGTEEQVSIGSTSHAVFGGGNDFGVGRSQLRRDAAVRLDNGCTGTLIAPRIVTTAFHCVSGRGGYPGPPSRVFLGATRGSEGEEAVDVVRCLHLPGAISDPPRLRACGEGGVHVYSRDLALLFLAERIDAGPEDGLPRTPRFAAVPMALAPERDPLFWVHPPTRVRLAGWGSTAEDDDDYVAPTVRQFRPATLQDVSDTHNTLLLEGFGRPGDSGAPTTWAIPISVTFNWLPNTREARTMRSPTVAARSPSRIRPSTPG